MYKTPYYLCLSVFLAIVATQVKANDSSNPWWFEVELILFERNISADDIAEQFPLQVTQIDTQGMHDFITETLLPDFQFLRQGAEVCNQESAPIAFPTQVFTATPIQNQLLEEALLHDPEWVTSTKPSEQLQNMLDSIIDVDELALGTPQQTEFTQQFLFDDLIPQEQSPEIQVPDNLYCQWPAETEYFSNEHAKYLQTQVKLVTLPTTLNGIEYPYSEKAYTLPQDNLQLRKLRNDINRTRGLNVLLHTAWRQNVIVGRDKAPWYRIYAGENFSEDFYYSGLPKSLAESEQSFQQQNLYQKIAAILNQQSYQTLEITEPPAELIALQNSELNDESLSVWTIDGRLKIFIEYIGRTPYLHLDSDLNFRKPIVIDWQNFKRPLTASAEENSEADNTALPMQPNFLQAYHFDQLRRMISTEIHYFDHPMFGMVVQIRRYNRPTPPTEDTFDE